MERVASWGVLQPHLTELEAVQWKDKMVFKLICEDPWVNFHYAFPASRWV